MVNICDLHVGDKVKIVDEWCKGCYQNHKGLMDKWLSKTMTVRIVHPSSVDMEEDIHDCPYSPDGWGWFPPALDHIVYAKGDVNNIDGVISFIDTIRGEN